MRAVFKTLLIATAVVLAGTQARAQVFEPERFTLDNGLTVLVLSNHRAPVVTQMIWYPVGAADEPPGKGGIAHMLEHMMFRGSENVPPGEFSHIVSRLGGRGNAFTSFDYTAYFQTVAAHHLEEVMRIEADRMAAPTVLEEEFLPERDVVLEERFQVVDNRPEARLREQAALSLWGPHPYAQPVIGWEHEIRAYEVEDAVDFHRAWYSPHTAVLVIAGAVTKDEVRTLAERHYGPIAPRETPERLRPPPPHEPVTLRAEMRHPQVGQPSWSRTYIAPSYRLDDEGHVHALEVAAEILGGDTGRLYQALVEDQGIAVSAGAWYGPSAFDQGRFGLFASPRPGVDIESLEAALMAEIEGFLETGAESAAVERAKRRLVADSVFARDSLGRGPRALGMALMVGRSVEDVETWPQAIEAVTPEEVTQAARALLSAGAVRNLATVLLPERD